MELGARNERLFVVIGVLLVAGCVAALLAETWRVRPQIDDAYISYRYASNLAEGAGLVYNPGERVEGFTNLLFTLVVALGVRLGVDAPTVGHVVGVGSAVLLLVGCASYASTGLAPRRRARAAAAPWLLLAHPAIVIWAESGMESTLFAAAVTWALALQARGLALACTACLMVACLTRPEGALFAALVLGTDWLQRAPADRRMSGPMIIAGLLAALTAFRIAYYGAPLPNTFYAKVTTEASLGVGAAQVLDFLLSGPLLWLPGVAACAVLDRRARATALVVAAGLAYVVAIGGDTIGPTRFLLPVLAPMAAAAARAPELIRHSPMWAHAMRGLALAGAAWPLVGPGPALLALLVGAALLTLSRWTGWRASPAATAAIVLAAVAGLALAVMAGRPWTGLGFGAAHRAEQIAQIRQTRHRQAALARRQADRLEARAPRLIALAGIGHVGFQTRLPLIDLLGLVDATIARTPIPDDDAFLALPGHQRSNADYVLSRRPDYIMVGRDNGGRFLLRAHHDLHAHPDFHRLYTWDEGILGYRRLDAE